MENIILAVIGNLIILIIITMAWIVWAIVEARKRGISEWIGVLLGFLFGLVGVIIVANLPKKKFCQFCQERINANASICPYCQREVGITNDKKTSHCSYCGQLIQKEFVVCPNCNRLIDWNYFELKEGHQRFTRIFSGLFGWVSGSLTVAAGYAQLNRAHFVFEDILRFLSGFCFWGGITYVLLSVIFWIIREIKKNKKSRPEISTNVPLPNNYNNYIRTYVAGGAFENQQDVIPQLKSGEMVWLFFEPEDLNGGNSIAVRTLEGKLVGYINHSLAKIVATSLKEANYISNKQIKAQIIDLKRVNSSVIGVEIEFRMPLPTKPNENQSLLNNLEDLPITINSKNLEASSLLKEIRNDEQINGHLTKISTVETLRTKKDSKAETKFLIIFLSILFMLFVVIPVIFSTASHQYNEPLATSSRATLDAISEVVVTPTVKKMLVITSTITITTPAPLGVVCFQQRQNIRQGPGVSYKIIDTKSSDFCAEGFQYNDDNSWIKIKYDQEEGWVYVPYAKILADWPAK